MKSRVNLDEKLLDDLHLIISRSPLLKECYEGLPDDQRDAVDDRFLDLQWDTILSGHGHKMDGNPNRSTLGPILDELQAKAKKR